MTDDLTLGGASLPPSADEETPDADALKPSPLLGTIEPVAAPDQYASVGELLAVDDLMECAVKHPAWTIGGRPLVLRVRALSLESQESILRAARIAGAERAKASKETATSAPSQDWETYCIETMRVGVIQPSLTKAHARLLISKNAKAIEDLVNFIWGLALTNREYIEGIVNDLTREDSASSEVDRA